MADFSKQYRELFNSAKEANNTEMMTSVFNQLCDEAGLPDPVSEQAQTEAGKRAAELANQRLFGEEGKKVFQIK